MSALQQSCSVPSSPRRNAGADQSARLSLEISTIEDHAELVPVAAEERLQMPFCALSRLARTDRTDLPKVLVVAPLSGHFSVLLRDLVLGLLPFCQVFITDWVNARHVPVDRGRFDLEANIFYVVEAMRAVGPDLHVIALCQGAVPALVATAYQAESDAASTPRSLILIAAPVDPAANPTRVSRLLRARPLSWYEHNVIGAVPAASAGKGRLVYPGSVQVLGLWAYLARHVSEGGELLFKLIADDGVDPVRFPFLNLYLSVMDLPAEVFLDIVHHVYQEHTLVKRKFWVGNGALSLRAIRATALMTVEGERDDIAAPGQTGSALDLCSSVPGEAKRRLIVPACGHFSLFHGRRWRTQVLPEVRAFIERFDQPQGRIGA